MIAPVWPNPGIYFDVPQSEYFDLKEIGGVIVRSNSTLHNFNRDPALFRAGFEKKTTAAMKGGSLLDCLLTSPHRFDEDYVVSPYDEFRTNESKKWRDEQLKIIVKQSEYEAAAETVKSLESDPRWKDVTFGNPNFQVAMRADIDGKPFKALIDILPDPSGPYGDAIVDIKRCGTMEDMDAVLRTCRKFEYNHQGGLYRGMARLLGEKRKRYILFIVPATGPITPCVLELGEQMLSNGANAIMRINQRLTECEETGIWPGRFDGVKQIEQADETWQWTEVLPPIEEAA